MYIPILSAPPSPPSREAQELADLLAAATDAYQRDHPQLSRHDVQRAVELIQQSSGPSNVSVAKGLVLGLAVFLGLIAFYLGSAGVPGQGGEGGIPFVMIAIGVLVVLLGAIAFVKR